MTSGENRLQLYVDTWASTVDDVLALLRSLDDDDWSQPTDLPGWDVRAVAAHLAHLESELAGNEQAEVDVPQSDHITSLTSAHTERGPLARATWSTDEIIDELDRSCAKRLAELRADPPTDPKGDPPLTPANIGWSWETMLSNRPVDVWMHEQDIRRAVDRPGGLDSAGAAHTTGVFARGLPYVVGKRVAPPAGTSVVLEVTGPHLVHAATIVGEDGRAQPLAHDPAEPTVHITTDIESYIVLCGGRRGVDSVHVALEGDEKLGLRVLEAMAVTP